MMCCVMLCYVMLCYVMLCYVMLYYVTLLYVMLYYIILYYIILYYIILYYIMLRYTILCYLWFDLQLDALNSCLFTYNTFIKILYMFRALALLIIRRYTSQLYMCSLWFQHHIHEARASKS
jgi:hypothetical protein